MRIDDLDRERCQVRFEDDILRTLERFGLFWDGAVSRQSDHAEQYLATFERLRQAGLIYPCGCSRGEIGRIASAPHPGEEVPYPGTCRNGLPVGRTARSWRLCTADRQVSFHDQRHGSINHDFTNSGDFIVRRVEGYYAYQLAVVVDDRLAGVNQVVRGDDLLGSTPRQALLHQLLGWPLPVYCHLPLVTGADGAKLSKRDNSISVSDGTLSGKEGLLMVWALEFLGLVVPETLRGAPCAELLEWGLANI